MCSRVIIVFFVSGFCLKLGAQSTRGLSDFPEIVNTTIPGAPRLSKPVLINGQSESVVARGFGLAAPAFFDFDRDGLKDLVIGEFGSGVENQWHISVGNFLRVFKNEGSESNPIFSGRCYYASPPFEYQALGNGTPYSVAQFCCMGFTPQFVDLNNDGYQDMITGQYQGEVSWFEGTEKGFLPAKQLPQDGNPRGKMTTESLYYWLYSAASFGDFTGDGLDDLIVGGGSLRMSRNVGTKDTPRFSRRELLLDIDGKPLQIYDYLPEDWEFKFQKGGIFDGVKIPEAGDSKLSPYVVDWDGDGVLDLLVTNSYHHAGLSVVDFFKGIIRSDGEYRFQSAKPLFVAKDRSKDFPGSTPRIFVTDYNQDGIKDLMVGVSIALMSGQFNGRLAWTWEKEMELNGAGKDPHFLSLSDENLKWYRTSTKLPPGVTFDEFMTIEHIGYVYIMLGTLDKKKPLELNSQKSKK